MQNFLSTDPYSFKKKVAVITGGGSGIGKATAEVLFTRGAYVVLVGRSARVEHVACKMNRGDRVICMRGDVTDEKIVRMLIHRIIKKFQRIDILITAAGIAKSGSLADISVKEWDEVIRNNLLSTFLMCKYAVPHMKRRHYGKIVSFSSVAGRFRGETTGLHYASAKAALIGFTRTLAYQLAPFKINVNAICPGSTDTPMQRSLLRTTKQRKLLESKIPLGYLARAEEQAEVVAFLVSDAASYMTGAIVDVNGGVF